MSTRDITCPKCSASFKLGSSPRSGSHLRCPYCGASFTVTARDRSARATMQPLVAALILGAAVVLLIGVLGGLGVAAAWSRPASPAPAPIAALPTQHEDHHDGWHHDWHGPPPGSALPVHLTQTRMPVPAPATAPAPAPMPAQADQCQTPAPADVLTGKWVIPLQDGVSFFAEFKPDGCVAYTIAAPGANATLGQYQAEGLTIEGMWRFRKVDLLALQMTGAEFRTVPTTVDPAQIAGLRLGDICKITVVDRNLLIVTSLKEHQRVEMTRVPC